MKRNRYFQWIAGENEGTISILDNITEYDGEYFYNFTDGESCNQRFVAKMTASPGDIKHKFVVEINSPNDPWKVETINSKTFTDVQTQERVEIPALDDIARASGSGQSLSIDKSHIGETRYIAPTYRGPFYELPSLDDYFVNDKCVDESTNTDAEAKKEDKSAVYVSPKRKKQDDDNIETTQENCINISDDMKPIKILVDKCKRKPIDIEMNITLNVPSTNVFNIANDEFENGSKLFVEYIVSQLDVAVIKESLKAALLETYLKTNNI